MASAAAPGERRSLDPHIWKACAGSSARIPAVGSLVYYFPQGHAEQAYGVADFSVCNRPYSVCRVGAVGYLASQETDEVYTRVGLDPRISSLAPTTALNFSSLSEDGGGGGGVVSFAKVLTPSDANNGGGFSVPRFCADSIFPPLDYDEDPPVQTLSVRDVHGTLWQFRHIYRGTPRRHLLTTGWSKFVNSKKLIAGDSVVFIRNRSGELFVGVRRIGRCGGPSEFLQCPPQLGIPSAVAAARSGEHSGSREAFSRNCRGRVTPEAVVEAVRLAGMDRPFEVMYYPRVGSSDFVVRKDLVEAALHVPWSIGTRVKMAVETEDSSRVTWFQGTVSCIIRHLAPFTSSPWRTLEVTWDEPDVLQNARKVSPWQVELVSVSPQIPSLFPSIKKPRITQNQELLTDDAEQKIFLPMSGFTNAMMGGTNSSVLSQNIFPAGMQGARHDLICVSSLFDFLSNGTQPMSSERLNCDKIPPKANLMPNELISGGIPQLETSLPPSLSSIDHYGRELLLNSAGKTHSKVINVSFQLFGKVIHMEQPIVADVKEGFKDKRTVDRSFNVSVFDPLKEVHDSHDSPPRRVSTAET